MNATDMIIQKKRELFCSSLVVLIWYTYFQYTSFVQQQQQKQRQKFVRGIRPISCTPQDLKYFVDYFPHLFTFVTNIQDIKIGCILKTNFWGAPHYGHTMLVISKPENKTPMLPKQKLQKLLSSPQQQQKTKLLPKSLPSSQLESKYTYISFDVLHMMSSGIAQRRIVLSVDENGACHEQIFPGHVYYTGSLRLYALNPIKDVDVKRFQSIVSKMNLSSNITYSTSKAIASAFFPCYSYSYRSFFKIPFFHDFEKHVIKRKCLYYQ